MDEALAAWEGVAADVLDATGCDVPPVDAFELAECTGHEVRHGRARRVERVIYVDTHARLVRQHGLVAHELAHWALARANEANTEPAASYVASALLLPRRYFDVDLRQTWDLEALRAKHVNASAELIARRIVALRDAVATIVDGGKVRSRVWSPWLGERFRRVSRWERELADRALESGETVRGDERCYAVPIFDGSWRRVVIVCEAEQLSLRL